MSKNYFSELKTLKDEYINDRIQALQEQHTKLYKEVIQEKYCALIESWQEAKSSVAAYSSSVLVNLMTEIDDLKIKWKYRNTEKYLLMAGIVLVSGYGLYLLYKTHKVRSDKEIIENYYNHRQRFINHLETAIGEEEIEDFDHFMFDDAASDLISQKKLLATKYNKSNLLKKPLSTSRLVEVKAKHQTNLNDLLNIIDKKLERYPLILVRPFKTINSRCIDARSQFRIMQWNGLAKNAVQCLKSPKVPLALQDWKDFRKWRLLEELLRYNCDIICLQEADFYEDIKPFLHGLGYASVFCPKMLTNLSKELNNVDSDGCAIFYNLNVFQITQLRSQSICLNGEHESQVFIIVQLKHKFTKKRVTIISVHLKAYEDFATKRAKQIEFILKVLKEHVLETEQDAFNNQAVILCGDMNGDFLEPFYKLIVNDEVFKFRDAYPKFEKSNRRQKNAIDYVFYTDECLNLMNLLEVDVPSKKRHFELPSLEYPSDHFSLVCDFQIAK